MAFEQNTDGLSVNYGIKPKAQGGHTGMTGSFHEVEVNLEFGDGLPTVAAGETLLGGHVGGAGHVPAGALLRSATLIITTAFTSGGSATLSIGTVTQAGVTIDADGIDATIALTAIDAIGDEIACDGAVVGTVVAVDSFISATVATADMTAGKGKLVLEYMIPSN